MPDQPHFPTFDHPSRRLELHILTQNDSSPTYPKRSQRLIPQETIHSPTFTTSASCSYRLIFLQRTPHARYPASGQCSYPANAHTNTGHATFPISAHCSQGLPFPHMPEQDAFHASDHSAPCLFSAPRLPGMHTRRHVRHTFRVDIPLAARTVHGDCNGWAHCGGASPSPSLGAGSGTPRLRVPRRRSRPPPSLRCLLRPL